ncbi:hypothetical protein OEZ85_011293 [Tetradesmus obliquus]|uniref:Uncharacterized protein n=1 Tax=Tetradesmus obliquus TaxID=3088 RepID=A0ABY8TPV7_TETOB|nr:hypothetical protein OEZ85_011293 [Tetradesmus obliquus]
MASSAAGDPGGSPPGAAVVRLSPLLRAYGASGDDTDYESAYWKSSEVSMFLVRADMLGLSMVLFNQLLMRIQQTRRSVALAGSVQISCIFSLPTAANLLQLPFATAQSLSWVWNAPLAMHKVRGMQQLATSVCNGFRGTLELILYVIVDLGAMPGVPAARVDAFGLPDRRGLNGGYASYRVELACSSVAAAAGMSATNRVGRV